MTLGELDSRFHGKTYVYDNDCDAGIHLSEREPQGPLFTIFSHIPITEYLHQKYVLAEVEAIYAAGLHEIICVINLGDDAV